MLLPQGAERPKGAGEEAPSRFQGDSYACGLGVMDKVGEFAKGFGHRALVVASHADWFRPTLDKVLASLDKWGLSLQAPGWCLTWRRAPREDVYRITTYILQSKPDCLIAVGGGAP